MLAVLSIPPATNRFPGHVGVGDATGSRVALDQAHGVHVQVVPGLVAVDCLRGNELAAEGAVGAFGLEDGQGLGELAGLQVLVPLPVALLQPGPGEPADQRELVQGLR
jgi:hypothetical protein